MAGQSEPLERERPTLPGAGLGALAVPLLRPRLKLFCEAVCVDAGEALGVPRYEERRLPVAALSFEYEGFTVRACDPSERIFCSRSGGVAAWARDRDAERTARCLLESFGAIELELLEDHATAPDSDADYLVNLGGDEHGHCAFTAYAVPQLRALGWHIELEAAYPFRVLDHEPSWYATTCEIEDKPDWFSLELGIEIDGKRLNLLPVLLRLIEREDLQLQRQSPATGGRMPCPRFVQIPSAGAYAQLPEDRLQVLLQVVSELYQGCDVEAPSIAFPAARAGALQRLASAFADTPSPLRIGGDERVRARARALSCPAAAEPCDSRLLQAELRPYQLAGVHWMSRLRAHKASGVLADDMGLGKTLQTIALLCLEKESGRADAPSIVIAPTSLVGNWRRELARFAPGLAVVALHGPGRAAARERALAADVVLTSYPVLARDEAFFVEQRFHYVVLDEAQAIKNPRSRVSGLVRTLDAEHRLCLTGTPIENNLGELWSLFDFLMPDLLGSEQQFSHFFRTPIEHHGDEDRLAALTDLVSPYVMRRMKDQVARDLPPKTEVVLPIELRGKQRELYEHIRVAAHQKVRSAISKRGLAASTVTILDALMRLRQLCCDPRLMRGEAARLVAESAKYEALFSLLERQLQDGRRILLFSQFASMLALIARGLCERDVRYVTLTGATRDRDRPVRSFERGDAEVFLISLKAGGTGLNLVSADTVVHYDPWWNPAAQDQATDRAYRIGQTKPVFVYNLIAAGSVEERMLALQSRKRKLAQTIVSPSSEPRSPWTEGDVEHLLSPLAPE